jgi:protease I
LNLKGKTILLLVEDLYQELEFWYPYYRFIEEGATVLVAAPQKKEYHSKYGYPVTVELLAKDVKVDDIDAISIPGGFAPDYLRRYPHVVTLVKSAFEKGKVVAAICHAGSVLISADILRGKKATSFMAIRADIINAGAEYLDQEVVVDGNLITSRKPDDLPAYCHAIIAALQ